VSTITNYYFFGGAYEVEVNGATTTTTRYYAIGGQTVAMYDGTNLRYLLTDHLGSVVAVTDAIPYGYDGGGLVSQQRFSIPFGDLPFGQLRGTTPTVAGSARAHIRFVETVKPHNLYFLLPVGQLVL
jgi:hypothetical protein